MQVGIYSYDMYNCLMTERMNLFLSIFRVCKKLVQLPLGTFMNNIFTQHENSLMLAVIYFITLCQLKI